MKYVLDGIASGFPLGFTGPDCGYVCRNMASVEALPDVVEDYLEKELAGRRILGPFDEPPLSNFRCNPIGVVAKKARNKYRMIMNLSAPIGNSVNDYIDGDDYSLSYVTVDDAIKKIVATGPGCLLSKVDVEAAFRIIPVRPDDWNLLGFKYKGKFYIDTVLSMGGRSSPAIFNSVAELAEWIAVNNYSVEFLIHLLDDFFTVEVPGSGGRALSVVLQVFARLGIPVNGKKVEGPATTLEFLGIVLDTVRMEARLSVEKIEQLRLLLVSFESKKRCTQRELLSVVGSLSFACKVVVPGRSFLSRLIARAYMVRELFHSVRITACIRKDFKLWLRFLEEWNGRSLFLKSERMREGAEFSTDASGSLGFGGFFKGQWFSHRWNNQQALWSIEAKELFPILVAAQVWGSSWETLRVVVLCDNASVVGAINKGYSKVPLIGDMIRVLIYYSMHYNFLLRAEHIPGKLNVLSDLLSRLQVPRFRELAPAAEEHPVELPESPLLLCDKVFNV